MDLVVDGRVPLGSGLSSSAALICSAALAMCAAAGIDPDRQALVAATMRAESEVAGAPTGGLDQTAALLGEEGQALLIDFRDHTTRTVPWQPGDAGLELLVVDTRASHSHADGGYGSRREECEAAARELGVPSLREATADDLDRLDDERLRRRARHVVTEVQRVADTVAALGAGDWPRVGDAVHRLPRVDARRLRDLLRRARRGGRHRARARRAGRPDDRRRLRRLGHRPGPRRPRGATSPTGSRRRSPTTAGALPACCPRPPPAGARQVR